MLIAAAPLAVMLFLGGCSTNAFIAADPDSAAFLERRIVQKNDEVRIAAAVPDAAETEALTGLPLYSQGIQPVWLEVTNTGSRGLRLLIASIDRDYYSPLEVAWMNRGGYSDKGKADMERWFYENAIDRRIPPGETRSGLVYTHLTPGTKGFNVDVVASDLDSYSFTFFVPIPGFTADYMEVDFAGLYGPQEIETLSDDALREKIRDERCCATDESGTKQGDPFNVVIVAAPLALRRALLRAGWHETEAGSAETAIARLQRYRGRPPDGTFTKSRPDGAERKELRLWLAPATNGGEPMWLGQVVYNFGHAGDDTDDLRVDPDIDEARDYFLQDLWYGQSVRQAVYARAFDPVPEGDPVMTFSGSSYFSSGHCAVVWLSEEPVAMDDVHLLGWWTEEELE
ncbi:MAG: LssY C-terminal domain-containing protein [Woeseiaceae bacterium]